LEARQQRLGCEEPHAAVLADREEVLPIACGEYVHLHLDRAGQNLVVRRVARDRVGSLRRARSFRRQPGQQLSGYAGLRLVEAELLGQHPLQLVEDELRQD
jgi:hypothetical protein